MTLPRRLAEYDSPEGAREYLEEYEKLHRRLSDRREKAILRRWFAGLEPVGTVLDLPSGWGRYTPELQVLGRSLVRADYSGEMLRLARRLFPDPPALGAFRAFGHRIPARDRAFDLVFSMRLNHHLPDPEVRRGHLREILRVSAHYALFSYFDAASLKNRLRELERRLGRPKRAKNTLRRAEVEALIREAGFEIVESRLLFLLGSGHRLVLARRLPG